MNSRWVDGTYGRIHYLFRDGSGPDLVFLPGAVLDAAELTWKKVYEAIPEGYRIFVIDLPGFGRSDKPPAHVVSTRGMAAEVREVLRTLGVDRPVLFAASMSGAVALDLVPAADEELPFRALVFSGGYGFQERLPLHELAFGLSRFPGLAPLIRYPLRERSAMKKMLRLVVRDDDRIDRELLDDAVREARRPHALETFMMWLDHEIEPRHVMSNYGEALSRLRIPVLFVHGKHDWMMPASTIEDAARRMPDAELHLLDAGHMVPRERPREVNRIIRRFLEKVAPLP